MKNKLIIVMLLLLLFSTSMLGGFFIGRNITIKRNAKYFSRFVSYNTVKPEIENFRKEMAPLMEEKIKKNELLFIAISKGDSEFAYKISEEILQIEMIMREKTIRHIIETSKDIPPEMRKAFIKTMLLRNVRKIDQP